jgi:hypothetical protein
MVARQLLLTQQLQSLAAFKQRLIDQLPGRLKYQD